MEGNDHASLKSNRDEIGVGPTGACLCPDSRVSLVAWRQQCSCVRRSCRWSAKSGREQHCLGSDSPSWSIFGLASAAWSDPRRSGRCVRCSPEPGLHFLCQRLDRSISRSVFRRCGCEDHHWAVHCELGFFWHRHSGCGPLTHLRHRVRSVRFFRVGFIAFSTLHPSVCDPLDSPWVALFCRRRSGGCGPTHNGYCDRTGLSQLTHKWSRHALDRERARLICNVRWHQLPQSFGHFSPASANCITPTLPEPQIERGHQNQIENR